MSIHLSYNVIADLLGCEHASSDFNVTGAVIDSRKVNQGDLFVALKGEHVDGHDFISKARLAGASAALVDKQQDDPLPQLVVEDVKAAFAKIARYWQQQCKAKLVAITGSNGKTTLKEMVTAILSQVGKVTATQGNLNNDLGVPLTVCRMRADDDFAVIEMGANHPGDIATLVNIAEPDVAIINNVAAAHLEGFGSLDGVAKAKGEIYAGLKPNGIGVINADMPYIPLWQSLLDNRSIITFGLESEATVTASYSQIDNSSSHFMVKLDDVSHHFNLPLPGKHNIANALAAIAISQALNIPVEAMVKGLAAMHAVPHRLQLKTGINQSRIIDDTYNANPGSYQQALTTLAQFKGDHWLVLGDFGELGEQKQEIHRQMGEQARQAGVSRLFTVGKDSEVAAQSFGDGATHYQDIDVLKAELIDKLNQQVTCLIKGSRFMKLDILADELTQQGEG